jgi:hypothetical protein
MRVADVFRNPQIVLAIAIAHLGPSIPGVILALSATLALVHQGRGTPDALDHERDVRRVTRSLGSNQRA